MQTALVQWVSQVKKQWALIMTRITGEQYKIPKVAHLIWLCPHINTFAMTKQKWQGFSTSSSLLCFFYLVLQAPGKQINRWMQKADGRRHIERRYSMGKIQKQNVFDFWGNIFNASSNHSHNWPPSWMGNTLKIPTSNLIFHPIVPLIAPDHWRNWPFVSYSRWYAKLSPMDGQDNLTREIEAWLIPWYSHSSHQMNSVHFWMGSTPVPFPEYYFLIKHHIMT